MNRKILVVDDEKELCTCLEGVFTSRDFQVIVANDGRDAVSKAKEKNPDIILMDVMMPGMNGLDACRVIKDDPVYNSIPIIMLTAMDSMEDYAQGLECGADLYITKPYSLKNLLNKVNSLIEFS